MSKSIKDPKEILQIMKLEVEHEEGIPMTNRKTASLYDQIMHDVIALTDKKGLFVVTPQAKAQLTGFKYWLKGIEESQQSNSYFCQVGYNKALKLGIRVWCFKKDASASKNKNIEHLGGPGKSAKRTCKRRLSPKKL